MKRRNLLGVFVAACLAIPLHAHSEPPAPEPATGMMARIFDALEESKQRDATPSLMVRIFETLDDVRAKALEVAETAGEGEADAQATADERRG